MCHYRTVPTPVVTPLTEPQRSIVHGRNVQEFFMAALTGQERGLPPGSYLNDTVEAGPGVTDVSVVWQPYEDKVGP